MFAALKKYNFILFGFFFLLSTSPLLLKIGGDFHENRKKRELYNPSLARLNSVKSTVNYVDSLYESLYKNQFDTSKYVSIVSHTIKERFCFGLSNYQLSDNWLAFLSGKFIWSHFSGIVDPNEILKHPSGLCSQQTIIFQEVLKQKNIKTRSVGLGYKEGPGHFLCEVFYNDSWHLYDVTMEPTWKNITNHHKSIMYYTKNKDSLYPAYKDVYERPMFNKLLEKVEVGKTNEFPAKNMLLFHKITQFLTYFFPLFFLILFIKTFKKYIASKKKILIKEQVAISFQTEEVI